MNLDKPPLNQLLRLDVHPFGFGLPSRVEDLEDDDVVISAPSYPGDEAPLSAGAQLLVRWTGPRGLHALPVAMVTTVSGALPRWRVRPVGDVEMVQRRQFVRAPVDEPVTIIPRDQVITSVVGGTLVDLGEGGLRGRFASSAPMHTDAPVEIHLMLRDVPVMLVGRVLRCTSVEGAASRRLYEAVITFEPDEHNGDLIRRTVLHQQVVARRAARS